MKEKQSNEQSLNLTKKIEFNFGPNEDSVSNAALKEDKQDDCYIKSNKINLQMLFHDKIEKNITAGLHSESSEKDKIDFYDLNK